MKKIISAILMVFAFAATISAQQIEKIFDKYQEDERFQYVYKKGSNSTSFNNLNFGDVFDGERTGKMINKKMLILNTKEVNFEKSFTNEVDNALKSDKYENISYVRNGKNRVSEYYRETSRGIDKVQFIDNGSNNILLVWRSYEKQK
ncbi:MAG: hypothetical protein PHO94_04140 [Petrimonas sp.]|nr:hypothetical protein [Petrimonas sp.]